MISKGTYSWRCTSIRELIHRVIAWFLYPWVELECSRVEWCFINPDKSTLKIDEYSKEVSKDDSIFNHIRSITIPCHLLSSYEWHLKFLFENRSNSMKLDCIMPTPSLYFKINWLHCLDSSRESINSFLNYLNLSLSLLLKLNSLCRQILMLNWDSTESLKIVFQLWHWYWVYLCYLFKVQTKFIDVLVNKSRDLKELR